MDERDTRTLQPESLVLIEDELDAQRLIVTWPNVGHDWGSPDVPALPENLPYEDWSNISGVDETDVRRWAPVLFSNELLGPMGEVADLAQKYIRARIAFKLPKAARPAGGRP